MSTLIDSARSALYRDGMIVVVMDSGGEIRFPIRDNPESAKRSLVVLVN